MSESSVQRPIEPGSPAKPLTLYFHPLSNFCQKVLIALYENGTPFEPRVVNLTDESSRTAFRKIWPIGKFPVLRDNAKDRTIPESSVIIEYLNAHYPGASQLVPADADLARQARQSDRFYDWNMNLQVQKVVTDRLRPAGKSDSHGVEQATTLLRTALDMIERDMESKTWATGEQFTMADCAAAPALFYTNMVMPFGGTHKNVAKYFGRLMERPSFAQTVKEAQPFLALFPK